MLTFSGLQQVQWSNIKEVSRVQESQEKDEDDDEEEEENDDDDDNEKVNVGCHSVNGQEENLLLNVSCEVVAVIEKLSPHSKNVTGRLKSSTGKYKLNFLFFFNRLVAEFELETG